MSEYQNICECKSVFKKVKKNPTEISIIFPISFCLPCESPPLVELYDSNITIENINTKMLDTKVIIRVSLRVILYYFSVDQQLHRVEFFTEQVDSLNIKYYYRGTPKIIIKNISSNFDLSNHVSNTCKTLGYKEVKGEILLKGFILTPNEFY